MTIPNDESECPPISNLKVSDDMATAKELRAAAELLRACYSTDKCNDLTPGYEQAADLLSDHILATFRDDDDDEVTAEWVESLSPPRYWEAGREYSWPRTSLRYAMPLRCSGAGKGGFYIDRQEPTSKVMDHIKTRGDVRRLCAALNIPLPATK